MSRLGQEGGSSDGIPRRARNWDWADERRREIELKKRRDCFKAYVSVSTIEVMTQLMSRNNHSNRSHNTNRPARTSTQSRCRRMGITATVQTPPQMTPEAIIAAGVGRHDASPPRSIVAISSEDESVMSLGEDGSDTGHANTSGSSSAVPSLSNLEDCKKKQNCRKE